MADERLRGLERRFAEEGDLDAGRELVAHLRRTGEPVGGALLAADLRPPRSFASELPLAVYALTADDAVRWIGNTPSPAPLELPEHRTFWVRPLRSEPEHVARAAEELAAQQIPGFALSGRQALEPPPLPGHLELLRLQRPRAPVSLGLSLMPEPGFLVELPRLTRLELEHPAELELDPGPQLTELALGADEATCRQLLARWTGRALPLRRLELRVQGELLLEDATWAGLGELRELRAECGVFACPEAPLPHLETLDLRVMHASELSALLAGSPGLRELRYTGALGRLDPLAALPALEALYLGSSARAAPPALAALAAWPRLTRLGLSADLQAGWPQAVAALTGLTRLDLDAADRWPAEAWAALRGLPALRELVVRAAPESAPAWLGFLDGMPLTRLHLQTAREGDLEPWPALPELRHLSLVLAGEWSAEAFEALLAGGRLESLQLGGALVPARALEPLAELQPALESLRVHAEGVDDRTLEALGRLPALRELELVGVEPQDVTQIGWKALLRAPLERLHLSRVPPPGTSWRQALRFTLHSLRGNLDVGW